MKKTIIIFSIIFMCTVSAQNSVVKQFSDALADVAEKANPAVVTIMTETVMEMKSFHGGFPFDQFGFSPKNKPQRKYRGRALGSGVIVNKEKGYILTNNHVIDKAEEINVKLMDKRIFSATVIGKDPKTDLAVLQIETDDLTSLNLGDSDELRVGEWVMAVGSPFSENLSHTVTTGIVSALGRSNVFSGDHYENFIQTDAAINPGNSGGALLNMSGELVGINTAIATGGYEKANRGVGFAIPVNMVKKVMNDLIEHGYVVRAWLGVYIQEVNDDVAKALDLDTRDGALVSSIVEDSPAEKAGLEEGDVIIQFGERTVMNPANLKNIVSSTPSSTRREVTIIRDGKTKTLYVTLEELKENEAQSLAAQTQTEVLGLTVKNITPEDRERYELDDVDGVVVTNVEPESKAAREGLRPGDVITRVGTRRISSKKEFSKELKREKNTDSVLLLVKRGNISRFYTLER